MQGKLVWVLALVGILAIVGPSSGCKLCGVHLCSCAAPGHVAPSYSRSWDVEHHHRSGPPVHLTVPVIQPPSFGLGLGLGGGIGGGGGGGNVCQHCGGYHRGGYGYSMREDYGYPRGGFTCRCAPRRPRYRYDDY